MKTNLWICASALALATTSAYAQTSTAVTPAPAAKPTLGENTNLTYIGTYNGASVGSPFDGVQTFQASKSDEEIAGYRNPGAPVSLTNRFDLRFKVAEGYKVGPSLIFDYYGRSDSRLVLLDPFLAASNGSLTKWGDVNVAGELRVALPVSEASQANSLVTTINPRMTLTYTIPETSVVFEGLTSLSYRIYRRTGTQTTFVARQWVQGGYIFSDKFDAYLGFDMQLPIAGGSTGDIDTFAEIGANWNILSNLTLNPYVDMETNYRVAPDTSLWGANLIWGIL